MRWMLAPLLALALALAFPAQVSAHALPISSSPAEGSTVLVAPAEVEITFGEAIDPKLSTITVDDSSGASVDLGPSTGVPGHLDQLVVLVKPIATGVYIVTWRSVSTDDGHLAAGSFAFGVGVSAGSANTTAHGQLQSPPPSVLAIASRWVLLCALILLIGLATTSLFVLRAAPKFAPRLAVWGWLVSLGGCFGMAEAERESTALTWSQLLTTSLGSGLAWRMGSIALLGLTVAQLLRSGDRRQRLWLGAMGIGAGLVLAVEVGQSHAAAKSPVVLNLVFQWLHVAAVGVWIGGLAVLLLAVWKHEGADRGEIVRRFSFTAGICIVIVGITGVVRAIFEIPSWDQLFGSAYGIIVLVKVGLFLVLATLGAVNRYQKVPHAAKTVRGLQRVASTEVVIAVFVLALAAGLVNVAPPEPVAANLAPQVQVEPGLNGLPTLYTVELTQGRTLQVYLDPDQPGFNEFHMTYFDNKGNELRVSTVIVGMTPPSGKLTVLSDRALDGVGHFVADANVTSGNTRFDVSGTTPTGELLATYVLISLS